MERADRESVATFFAADEPLAPGAAISLGETVARHARVLRIGPGSRIRLVDGAGHRATGVIVRLSREAVAVEIAWVVETPAPPPVHLLVPVADRDRMLWLAEKCAELEATSWRPVLWKRSRSVKPRGEGPAFTARVRARMVAALEQSSGARLPAMYPDATPERAIAALPEGTRLFLDPSGDAILDRALPGSVTIAVGPEGGWDAIERDILGGAGFQPVSLGPAILRFETAAVAALAIVRAARTLSTQVTDGH